MFVLPPYHLFLALADMILDIIVFNYETTGLPLLDCLQFSQVWCSRGEVLDDKILVLCMAIKK